MKRRTGWPASRRTSQVKILTSKNGKSFGFIKHKYFGEINIFIELEGVVKAFIVSCISFKLNLVSFCKQKKVEAWHSHRAELSVRNTALRRGGGEGINALRVMKFPRKELISCPKLQFSISYIFRKKVEDFKL